jgi:hypothetical protein
VIFGVSVTLTKSFISFKYTYQIQKEQQDLVEKEIVDAELSGFQFKK